MKTYSKWYLKTSLNTDSQQFHQYQQNEQSPLKLLTTTKSADGNPGRGLEQILNNIFVYNLIVFNIF